MNKLEKAVYECYTRMYDAATPKANFKELVDNAEINEQGQRVIKFLDYTITREQSEKIIQDVFIKYKIKNEWDRKRVRFTVLMGCSPKFVD